MKFPNGNYNVEVKDNRCLYHLTGICTIRLRKNQFFNELRNKNYINIFSPTDKGAVFAGGFNRTIRALLNKPIFLAGKASWISELPSVI